MRKFILTNANGNTYSLNSLNSFLENPEGLGFEYDVEYENYNNYFVETSRELKQIEFKGDVHFKTYEEYYNFMLFCQYKPLELAYTAYKTFYMTCNVDRIKKEEIKENNRVTCPIKIVGLTPFYEKITKKNEQTDSEGKTYSYTYPYKYVDTDTGVIELDVLTNLNSGISLTLLGPLINPTWAHYVNGEKILSGKINAEIDENNRLVIDSSTIPYSIQEKDSYNNVVKDRYQNSDFSTKRFIILRDGLNKISCTHEGTNRIQMIVEAHVNYESV